MLEITRGVSFTTRKHGRQIDLTYFENAYNSKCSIFKRVEVIELKTCKRCISEIILPLLKVNLNSEGVAVLMASRGNQV